MKTYNKPALRKHGELRSITFSRENDEPQKKESILRPFSDYVRESKEHAKNYKEEE